MNGNRQSEIIDGGRISPKAIFYPLESFQGLGNLFLLVLGSLATGIIAERSIFRRGGR